MPHSTFAFTLAKLERLKPHAKQRWFSDAKQPGLQIVVTPKGQRTFYFYKWADGKPRRLRLGRFPELSLTKARCKARDLANDIERGGSMTASGELTLTFADAFSYWMEHHAKRHKKTWKADQRKFDGPLKPFHNRRLRDISKDEVRKFHNRLGSTQGPIAANRHLALIRSVFNFAISEEKFSDQNPASRIKMFPEVSRERYLSQAELRCFFTALDKESPLYQDFFQTLLFTGVRRSNLSAMQWKDIDLDAAIWTVGETKQGKTEFVTLAPQVIEILERRKTEARNQWVFPSPRRPWTYLRDPRKAWERILESADLAEVRMHDLRRTLGSWQAAQGSSALIIGKSLGHAAGSQATHVYARLGLQPVRESVNAAVSHMLKAKGVGDA